MFGRLGWAEILIIVVLVLILFGHNKIPSMMKNVADGLKVFKKEMKSDAKAGHGDEKTSAKSVKTAKPVRVKKNTKKHVADASANGAYVEFGAYASAAAAQNARRKLVAANDGLFDDVEFVILNDASAGARTAFKLRAVFANVAAAKKFQASVAKDGVKCRVVEI